MEQSEYTNKDVKEFAETDCPQEMVGSDKPRLRQKMEEMDWVPSRLRKPQKTEGPIEEIDTPVIGYVANQTGWTFINNLDLDIECDVCGYEASLDDSGDPPEYCDSCGRKTRPINPVR